MSTDLAPVAAPAQGAFTAAIDCSSLDLSEITQLMIGFTGAGAAEQWCPYFGLSNALTPTPSNLAGLTPAPNVPQDSANRPVLIGPGPFSLPFGPINPAPGAYLYILRLLGAAAGVQIQVSGQS
jgi:hypothetical protein